MITLSNLTARGPVRQIFPIAFALLSFFVLCGMCQTSGDESIPEPAPYTVMIDGEEREYFIRLPADFDREETYWLMVASHGAVGRYWQLLEQAGLRAILVTPSFQMRPRGYMCFPSLGEGDVLLRMIEQLRASYRLHSKILLTGFSGGANFVHRFAFQHSELVMACAAYAAGSWSTPDGRFLVKGIGEVRDASTFANGKPIPVERRSDKEHYLNDWAVRAGKQKAPLRASKVPFLVMCGSQDTDRIQNARDFAQSLRAAAFQVETDWPKTTHRLTVEVQRRVVEYFKQIVADDARTGK